MTTCTANTVDRRSPFWAWQPAACGAELDECGNVCASAGLSFAAEDCRDGCGRIACADRSAPPRSLETSGYVRSLILGTLLTRGRRNDTGCRRRPGHVGGHWSDSLRPGWRTGSRLYDGPSGSSRAGEVVSWLKSVVTLDLSFLAKEGLVDRLDVTASYVGGNQFEVAISWAGSSGSGVVAIGGGRVGSAYIWNGVPRS